MEGLVTLISEFDCDDSGQKMYALVERLYPLCRSITGQGLRETLKIISEHIPLQVHEVPTGTKVFDWEVPREWKIRDAYVKNEDGEKVIDFNESNLHVVNYSAPIAAQMSLDELQPHLHTLPEHPDWIPYRTTYYWDSWGFCLADKIYQSLKPGQYDVRIDATLEPGSLSYGELVVEGETDERILLFAHVCHPSLCNDNLSGIALLTVLAGLLQSVKHRYTYHFVFAPATIGSISWLSRNEAILPSIRHGLVASVLGDAGDMHYKRTRSETDSIDRAVIHVLEQSGEPFEVMEFSPNGYDERQFCSPGIDLSVGRLTRSPNGAYPEYHTSADNLSLVQPEFLAKSLRMYLNALCCLETDVSYLNLQPKGEPQLGKRGLYRKMGGFQDIAETQLAMLWTLNMSDGMNSILDIAERSGMSYLQLHSAANALCEKGLLKQDQA